MLKDVLRLSGAGAFAQVLALAASPLLTRLYAPEDFGQLAIFAAALAVMTPLATLRYELAIPLPADSGDALALLLLCCTGALAGSLLLGLCGAVLWYGAIEAIAPAYAPPFVILIPLGLLLAVVQAVLTAWLTRTEQFQYIATIRFTTISATLAFQLCLGFVDAQAINLIWSMIAGYSLGLGLAIVYCRRAIAAAWTGAKLSRLRRLAGGYRKFATMSTPASIIDTLGSQLPNMVMPLLYGVTTAGQFLLASRVVAQPAVVLGQPVFQVFWARAARLSQDDPSALRALFVRLVATTLVLMSPAALLLPLGPGIFSVVFGEAWREAGTFAAALVIATIVGVPANATNNLNAYGRNAWQALWQLAYSGLVSMALLASWLWNLPALACAAAVTGAAVICYVALIFMNFFAIRHLHRERLHKRLDPSLGHGCKARSCVTEPVATGVAEWTKG